ncbi:hypothetical protein JCM10599A_28280 [Paraburkholderia kururiensis]
MRERGARVGHFAGISQGRRNRQAERARRGNGRRHAARERRSARRAHGCDANRIALKQGQREVKIGLHG